MHAPRINHLIIIIIVIIIIIKVMIIIITVLTRHFTFLYFYFILTRHSSSSVKDSRLIGYVTVRMYFICIICLTIFFLIKFDYPMPSFTSQRKVQYI